MTDETTAQHCVACGQVKLPSDYWTRKITYWQDLAVANRKVAEDNQADAERYRRLRAWRYELSAGLNFPDSETKWIDENDLDAAIDAAMKECGK